jgi:cold-inducible RNA-binding protein
MGKKLYVGNLPFIATDQDLGEIFTQAGQVVSAKVILDRDSGRSKGFGFVEMNSEVDAEKAISQLNGAQFSGRALTVNEARPMAPQEGGSSDHGGMNRNERNQRW